MNIVIVEDEIKIRNGLARLISSYPEHKVVAKAKNGREGFEAVTTYNPDLIFTDIKMPEMDGIEMLEKLNDRGNQCHSIILTGFAEFDYAKRAIACGADDYLLKPITVDAVEKVLNNISEKVSEEARLMEANPSSYLRAIIIGAFDGNEDNYKKAGIIFGLTDNSQLCLIRGYDSEGIFNHTDMNIAERFTDFRGLYISDDGKSCYLIYDLNNCRYKTIDELIDMLKRRLQVIDADSSTVWYIASLDSIDKLRNFDDYSDKKLLYTIALNHQIICDKDIENSTLKEYIYTQELEKIVEKILVRQDKDIWDEWVLEFINDMVNGCYEPYSVRQAFQNISNYILQLSSKLWPEKGRQLRELNATEEIASSKTLSEFKKYLLAEGDIICSGETVRDDIHNYTILKAITYIREHYSEKISQEDVANYLSITPEYLSTLFNREMGKNFAAFVNEFRVSHAKRMLKGSNLKIYEIAEKVGFSDTKYFNRVFKEIEGISPKEFKDR